MKKYLALGLALVLANSFVPANAATVCTHLWLTNASGSPPVVQGNAVDFTATGFAPLIDIYLDGVTVLTAYDPNSPPGATFVTSGTVTVPYGAHTLRNALDACTVDFTTVAPPPVPGTPTLSTSDSSVTPNVAYTLSWTVPSGTINHYSLHKSGSGGAQYDSTLPGGSTSVTLSSSTPPGTTKWLTYTLRACSTSDETSCGAWSNAVTVEVDAPCGRRCQ